MGLPRGHLAFLGAVSYQADKVVVGELDAFLGN